MRRVSRRDEDHLIKRQRLPGMFGKRQVAVVNGVKCSAQQPDSSEWGIIHRCDEWGESRVRGREQQRKVVPVDHFLIFLRAQFAVNVLCPPPLDGGDDL